MEQLAFAHVQGNHSRANMSKILKQAVDHYGICHKVGNIINELSF
jgi:hypothetical protein